MNIYHPKAISCHMQSIQFSLYDFYRIPALSSQFSRQSKMTFHIFAWHGATTPGKCIWKTLKNKIKFYFPLFVRCTWRSLLRLIKFFLLIIQTDNLTLIAHTIYIHFMVNNFCIAWSFTKVLMMLWREVLTFFFYCKIIIDSGTQQQKQRSSKKIVFKWEKEKCWLAYRSRRGGVRAFTFSACKTKWNEFLNYF